MASKADTSTQTKESYSFPEYGFAVEASSLDEALKLAEKKLEETK